LDLSNGHAALIGAGPPPLSSHGVLRGLDTPFRLRASRGTLGGMPPTRSLASRPVWLLALCAALALLVAALLPARIASACAAVFRPEAPVHIKGEEALIVWDPQRGRQHFIRKAGFEGATEDFGFHVPTPGRPMLGEADAAVFRRLFELYRRTEPAARGARGRRAVAVGAGAARPAVTVIERRVVAGLDAAVLAANDAGALDRWLEEHRY